MEKFINDLADIRKSYNNGIDDMWEKEKDIKNKFRTLKFGIHQRIVKPVISAKKKSQDIPLRLSKTLPKSAAKFESIVPKKEPVIFQVEGIPSKETDLYPNRSDIFQRKLYLNSRAQSSSKFPINTDSDSDNEKK